MIEIVALMGGAFAPVVERWSAGPRWLRTYYLLAVAMIAAMAVVARSGDLLRLVM